MIKKIKVKIKKPLLSDEYIITNKHVICKFKFLAVCFNDPESNPNNGIVVLSSEKLKELFIDQNIIYNSSQQNNIMCETLSTLKSWHPSITKVEINYNNIVQIDNFYDYPMTWNKFKDFILPFEYNKCIQNEVNFEQFKKIKHCVVNINIFFQLGKISKITDLNINFNYLHTLLTQSITKINKLQPTFLDEVTVQHEQLHFKIKSIDDEICAYPYVGFFPLNDYSI